MSDTYIPLMKAIIAAMKNDSAVGAVVNDRVYSYVPQEEQFPYALVSISSEDNSTKTFNGMRHTIQINIYSRDTDMGDIATAKAACYDLFHRKEANFSLDSGTLSILQFDNVSDIFRDGNTIEGVIRFTAIVT